MRISIPGKTFAFLLTFLAIFALRSFGERSPVNSAKSPHSSLRQFLRKVERSYNHVRALRARFVQTYVSGGSRRTESGIALFARGGKMRWDYLRPQPKLFLTDGKQVLLYLPSVGQLERSSVKKSEDYRVPFRLLLMRLHLRRYFSKIENANEALPHPPQDRVLLAIPKGGARSGYRRVLMVFDPKLNLRRLILTYADGSTMDFRFSGIERNPPLPSGAFTFHPPPGTEIIQQ